MPFLWSSFISPLYIHPQTHTHTHSTQTPPPNMHTHHTHRWASGPVVECRLYMRLTSHFHLVPGLRMGGTVPAFLRIPPWSAQGSNFTSTLRTSNRLTVIKFYVASCFCCLYSFLRMHHELPRINLMLWIFQNCCALHTVPNCLKMWTMNIFLPY